MNHTLKFLIVPLFLFFVTSVCAYGQTVRGIVVDAESGTPLAGATVVLQQADGDAQAHGLSLTADGQGSFVAHNMAAGRYSATAYAVGYQPERMAELLVAGNHEVVVQIRMRMLTTDLEAVTVRPAVNKSRPLNSTAVAGATMISTEEAERFAGTLDDIGRVVRRYVGTVGSAQDAGISTHGNPPSATMYRIDGAEVPPPMHFYGIGTHGTGELSALHTNLLANSDYYTAAAPAEMGNTLGGVLDLRLRPGNANTFEHSVKLSTLGLEATSEGPLSKKAGSSYILSYRYGLTNLADDLGIGILDGDQANYHDLTFKLNFPLKRGANLSLWGHGCWDKNYMQWDDENRQNWQSLYDQEDFRDSVSTLMGGISYDMHTPGGWLLNANLTAAHRRSAIVDRYAIYATDGSLLTPDNSGTATFAPPTPFMQTDETTLWLTATAGAQKRLTKHWLLKAGGSVRRIGYEFSLQEAENFRTGMLLPKGDADVAMGQVDAYVTNNLRYGPWTVNAGLHLAGWTLCDDWTLQPRLSAEWKLSEEHVLAMGYGMTTRAETYDTYFAAPGNRDLKPIRSHQVVLDYHWQPSLVFNLSAEAWGEWQSAVPVSPTGTYCSLNQFFFYSTDALVSEGKARNYGIAVGAERYMADGYYWMANASLFRSEYRATDLVWRPTLSDRRWAVNAVGGKEWKFGERHFLTVGVSLTLMGGLRRSPVDEAASAARYNEGWPYIIYDESRPMSQHEKEVVDLSLEVSYRFHGKRVDHIVGIDYLNILGWDEPFREYYCYSTHTIYFDRGCYSIPNVTYTIVF